MMYQYCHFPNPKLWTDMLSSLYYTYLNLSSVFDI